MITPEMAEHAKRLIAATDAAIEEYISSGKAKASNEALNIANLSCRSVRFCVSDYGDFDIEVVIEEASPNCIEFNSFVAERLRGMGFENVSSATEW